MCYPSQLTKHQLFRHWELLTEDLLGMLLQALTFTKIQHIVTTVDCQPMFDGGILINVVGQLKVCTESRSDCCLIWLV